ncbi:MAG: DUF3347 domain-containing protein [Chitinophagaceae bacterium]|nr:DUF3347 domain-containing protein [Chitinophagaceae bacterium]
MKKQIILLGSLVLLLTACNNQTNNETTEAPAVEEHAGDDHASMSAEDEANIVKVAAKYSQTNEQVSSLVKGLVADYLEMKDALVKSNEEGAVKSAEAMFDKLKSFDKSYLSSDEKTDFDQILPGLSSNAQTIAQSKLAEQRKSFLVLSDNMHNLVKTFSTGKELYQQFCPMYEGGAYWLSDSKKVLNPYYGDKMLTCGTVKEAIN